MEPVSTLDIECVPVSSLSMCALHQINLLVAWLCNLTPNEIKNEINLIWFQMLSPKW